jgi:hypothetical protein
MLAEMNAKMDANQEKATRLEEILAQMSAKMDTHLKKMREEFKPDQAEMRSILDAWLTDLKDGRKDKTACQEETKTEHNPGMMQPIEEHQGISNGEAIVMPIGRPRKLRRVRNLAAERRQRWKKRTRGYCGARRKLAAAFRKVSRRTKEVE